MARDSRPSNERLLDEAMAWFVRLRADDVTPEERRDFESWRAVSLAHAEAYEKARALWEVLGGPAAAVYEEEARSSSRASPAKGGRAAGRRKTRSTRSRAAPRQGPRRR